jgi:hypothetical protein
MKFQHLFLRSLLCSTLLCTTLVWTSPSQAGFEWVPPSQLPTTSAPVFSSPAPIMGDNSGPLTPMPDMSSAPPSVSQSYPPRSRPEIETAAIRPLDERDVIDSVELPPVGQMAAPVDLAPAETDRLMDPSFQNSFEQPQQPQQPMQRLSAAQTLPVPDEVMSRHSEIMANRMEQASFSKSVSSANAQDIVQGFGKKIPLAMALPQIVPNQFRIDYDSNVSQGNPISWTGGKHWVDVLNNSLRKARLHAVWSNDTTLRIVKGRGDALTKPIDSMFDNRGMMSASFAPSNTMATDMAQTLQPLTPLPVERSLVVNLNRKSRWQAPSGSSLREAMTRWGQEAGVQIVWKAKKDFPLTSNFSFDGTYDAAVDSILSLYDQDTMRPTAKLYPNVPQGPSVLVIE